MRTLSFTILIPSGPGFLSGDHTFTHSFNEVVSFWIIIAYSCWKAGCPRGPTNSALTSAEAMAAFTLRPTGQIGEIVTTTVLYNNPCCDEFNLWNKKISFAFDVITQHWDVAVRWNPSSRKARTRLTHVASTMVIGGLLAQWANGIIILSMDRACYEYPNRRFLSYQFISVASNCVALWSTCGKCVSWVTVKLGSQSAAHYRERCKPAEADGWEHKKTTRLYDQICQTIV